MVGLDYLALEHIITKLGETNEGIRGIVRMRQTCKELNQKIDQIVLESNLLEQLYTKTKRMASFLHAG